MKNVVIVMLSFQLGSSAVFAMDLKDFLSRVDKNHKGLQALALSEEASDDKRKAGDIGLVPILQLKASYLKDEKLPNFYGAQYAQTTTYSLGLSQKFSTGTTVSATASASQNENPGISGALAASLGKYVSGGLNFSLAQSLWKDAFGHGTRLRQDRESVTNSAEKTVADLQKRNLLVESEKAYWDLIYLQEELKLRQASLERSQRILTWVQRRVSDGIGDRADLLNAKALLASRKLQLQSSQDDLKAAQQKVADVLELPDLSQLPNLEGSIHQVRSSQYYVSGTGHIVSIDAYAKSLDSKIAKIASEEVADGLKSDLVLSGSYSSNPYSPNGSLDYVSSNITSFDKPTAAVALSWTYLFDTSVKSAQSSQARKQALSSQLKTERALLESESLWKEFKRRYDELGQKILTAQEISQLQTERAKAEQDKFSKGRSITQYVITAEQDAAEAELNLTKLKAEQRKLEAQGRLFMTIEEKI